VRRYTTLIVSLAVVLALFSATACRPRTYTDGSYQAVSQGDDYGYTWAEVVIAKDKITSVELKEFTDLGLEKDFATYEWAPAKTANETMPGRFVQKNGWDVDTIAQATNSSNKYKEAVKFALEKAKRKPATTTTYFNGTFMGKSAPDERGGWGLAWVTIQNDAITAVRLEETTIDQETDEVALKTDENYTYLQYFEAQDELPSRFVAAGPGGVANVDVYAGATGSTAKWKEAVQNALASARVK